MPIEKVEFLRECYLPNPSEWEQENDTQWTEEEEEQRWVIK